MLWLVAGLVLVAAEVVSGEFVLLMLGGGALVAAGARRSSSARWPAPWCSRSRRCCCCSGCARRCAAGWTAASRTRRRGPRPLVGGTATVVARVDGHGGRVRIGDDEWSARSFDEAQVIEPGERVTVVRISGATALVLAHHHPLH